MQNGIPFQDISEYGVAIHLDDLTEQQVAVAMNDDTSVTKKTYDLLGVTYEAVQREIKLKK